MRTQAALAQPKNPTSLWKPEARFLRIPVRQFNAVCIALAGLWLLLSLPLGIHFRPTRSDFGQFYIGGALVTEQNWSALYPLPLRGSLDNAGIWSQSKPDWKTLSRSRGVEDYTHFILPPPSALVFAPLGWMTYSQAFWTWMLISGASIWGVAIISGWLLRHLLRRETRYEGVLVVLIALSPMTARAARIGNVTPLLALAISFTILSLVRRRNHATGAAAIVVGSLLKYATLILLPLVVAMRRWKMLLLITGFGLTAVLLTWILAGPEPFREYFQVIAPTLSRPSWYPGNQSAAGLLSRIFGRPWPKLVTIGFDTLRFMSLAGVLAAIMKMRRPRWRNTARILAASALILSWLLIFSPIAWEHWDIFLCPLWGWLLWEGRRPGLRRAAAAIALVLTYWPAGIIQVAGIASFPVVFPEPFNSTQLVGALLVFALALTRLTQTNVQAGKPALPAAEPG